LDIKNFLQSSYSKKNFIEFIYDKFYGFEENNTDYEIPHIVSEQKNIQKYKFLGQVELDDRKEIGFFEFISTENKDIENNRVSFNKFLEKRVNDKLLDGAIAVFTNPSKPNIWRLSFIRFSYDENNRQQVSNLKRYTYVLGEQIPTKTAEQQLENLKYPRLNELELAFSVEKISKEFFTKYKELYHKLVKDITVVNKDKTTQKEQDILDDKNIVSFYIKKLLGRVVFLYFVQKKGWLNNEKKFLSKLYDTHVEANPSIDFYDEIMETLFFNALNTKRDNDTITLGGKEYTIPYLNGGLFESDEFDNENLTIPNKDFKTILELFDSYNFTVIEDTPHDSEIAIDPEMLGRVFEDLLEDRKEKGAFYTPREIVHYMSKKSIENYLETQLKEYKYDFTVDEFLKKTTFSDDVVLEFYTNHPVKFLKIDNYFEKLHPYKNLVVDFFMVAKLRGLWLDSKGQRIKNTTNAHSEITSKIWKVILKKQYTIVGINFGSNKEFKADNKTYKYPTILKYIQIEERYFTLAFLPNIWGDLELTTIFPIRIKEIKRKLQKIGKNLDEISENNFVFKSKVFEKIKELQEDCRPLHTEPLSLSQVEELPRQAVIQKGLSTFYNSFNEESLTDEHLRNVLTGFNYYDRFINSLLNHSNTPQDHLKKLMIILLNKIKVLDPAIGSGAFPMGILHEIVDARIHLGDKTPISDMKRKVIENSIYGVDIEQSAVEIARLRFWLSIVVDADKPTPLPNLSYKIMIGNSLLETINGFDPLKKSELNKGNGARIKRMKEKFHAFYNASLNSEKNIIKEDIEKDVDDIFGVALKNYQKELEIITSKNDLFNTNTKLQKEHLKQTQNVALIKKILKEYENNKYTTELFLYKIYFAEVLENGGFDVVIGNPPYVRQEKIKELKSKQEIQDFRSYCGTADLYIYFFEKGYKLLKENGILSYITSNKYTRAKYGKDFRKFVLENSAIKEYVDFNGVKVFESATVDTSIITYQKAKIKNNSFIYCDVDETYKKGSELNKFVNDKGFNYSQSDLSVDNFNFMSRERITTKNRIEKKGICLKDFDIEIYRGIQTGNNNVFVIDEEQKNKIINDDNKSQEIIFPIITGKEIKKYSLQGKNKYLIYTTNETNIQEYPAIYKYLLNNKNSLDKKIEVQQNKMQWFALYRPAKRHVSKFNDEKLLWNFVTENLTFSYNNTNLLLLNSSFMMVGLDLKYLSSILNSKVSNFYIEFISSAPNIGAKAYVENLRIPKIPKEQQKPFEILVDYILFAKEQDMKSEASLFESIIDGMVYDLYFEEDMKKADCFISDEVTKIIQEFDGNLDMIKDMYKVFNTNKIIGRGLLYRRVISVVKTIEGDDKK